VAPATAPLAAPAVDSDRGRQPLRCSPTLDGRAFPHPQHGREHPAAPSTCLGAHGQQHLAAARSSCQDLWSGERQWDAGVVPAAPTWSVHGHPLLERRMQPPAEPALVTPAAVHPLEQQRPAAPTAYRGRQRPAPQQLFLQRSFTCISGRHQRTGRLHLQKAAPSAPACSPPRIGRFHGGTAVPQRPQRPAPACQGQQMLPPASPGPALVNDCTTGDYLSRPMAGRGAWSSAVQQR